MALTFGTLLSSQGADAHELDPSGLPSWLNVLLCAGFQHPPQEAWSGGPPGPRGADRTLHEVLRPLQGGPDAGRREAHATPWGRNCTLTRGPTGLVVFGMQCSHVR